MRRAIMRAAVMGGAAALAGCGSTPMGMAEGEPAAAPEQIVVAAPATTPRVVEPAAEVPMSPPVAGPVAPAPVAPPVAGDFREVFPHVMVDAVAKVVRFEGIVPIDAHDERAPSVFLEVVVCSPDTKEHEALVVTEAKPSHVHAAMLLVGLKPGSPGRWEFENDTLIPIPPTGDHLSVTLTYRDAEGKERTVTPEELVVDAKDGRSFGAAGGGRWVFAGSQLVTRAGREWYDADGAGTLVGLTTFGSETIAWSEVISPEAAVQEPEWIARSGATPAIGTPVTVTIRRAE